MSELTTVIVFLKALVLPAGAAVTYVAYRAYRRTGAVALRSLAAALGALTAGALLGGGVERFVGVATEVGLLVGTALSVVGFAFLIHALYAQGVRPESIDIDLSSHDR
jgi:hypothetical protein